MRSATITPRIDKRTTTESIRGLLTGGFAGTRREDVDGIFTVLAHMLPEASREHTTEATEALVRVGFSRAPAVGQGSVLTSAEEMDALPEGTLILVPCTNPDYPSIYRKVWRGEWLELDPSDKEDGSCGSHAETVLRWSSADHTVTVLWVPGVARASTGATNE